MLDGTRTDIQRRLSDTEIGWLVVAGLFGWIKIRAEQATAEGWDVEETLRQTSLNPQPWDAGAIEQMLPEVGALPGIDWTKPVSGWSKDQMVHFLLQADKIPFPISNNTPVEIG